MPHVICLAKQVPDPETPASQFRVDEAAKKVLPAPGIQPVPSQFDTIGVEAALRIKDKQPDTVITDPAVNSADHWATAEVLAAAIQKLAPFDLIVAGRQAVDWDMGVVGSTIAEILGIPVVTIAKDIQHNDGKVTVERVLLDGFETVESSTPCVVTVSNELGEPRYPQLRQIMMAAKKEVKPWTLSDLGISAPQNRINIEALFVPETKVENEWIEGDSPQEKAEKLALRLREAKLI